jgi:hypothetical protein
MAQGPNCIPLILSGVFYANQGLGCEPEKLSKVSSKVEFLNSKWLLLNLKFVENSKKCKCSFVGFLVTNPTTLTKHNHTFFGSFCTKNRNSKNLDQLYLQIHM